MPHPDYQQLLQELRHQQGGGAATRGPPGDADAALAAHAGTRILPSRQKEEVPGHGLPPSKMPPPPATIGRGAFALKHGSPATQADVVEMHSPVKAHLSRSTTLATSVQITKSTAAASSAAWPKAEVAGPLRIGQAELQRQLEALRETPVVEVPDLLVADLSASALDAAAGICSLMRDPVSL